MTRSFVGTAAFCLAFALAGIAHADQAGENALALKSVQEDYFFSTDFRKVKGFPTFSMAAPSGITPYQDVAFAGVGGIYNVPGQKTSVDGSASIGFGKGNQDLKLGTLLTLDLGSISGRNGPPGDRGDLGIAVGKFFQDHGAGISVGVKGITLWQGGAGRNNPSVYLTATKILPLGRTLLIINGGVGNNAFRTIRDTSPSSERLRKWSPFGSAAFYPLPQISLVIDNTAGITTAGVGLSPVAAWPLSLSFGIYDITKEIPKHTKTSVVGSASFSFRF